MDRDRVTIQEAARRLGVSEGAVRKRVTRGTLEHDKEPDGRVCVYLDVGVDPNSSTLISRLEGEMEFLWDQVRRQQEIIAQQAITMRQLTAGTPSEPPESPESPGPSEDPPPRPRETLTRPHRARRRAIRPGRGGVGCGEARR